MQGQGSPPPRGKASTGLVLISGGVLIVIGSLALILVAGQVPEKALPLEELPGTDAETFVLVQKARLDREAAFAANERGTVLIVPLRRTEGEARPQDTLCFAAVTQKQLAAIPPDAPVRGKVLELKGHTLPKGIGADATVLDLGQSPDMLSRGGLILSAVGFLCILGGAFRRILSRPAEPEDEGPTGATSPADARDTGTAAG